MSSDRARAAGAVDVHHVHREDPLSIDHERRGAVAVVTLDRPEALNALSPAMLSELEDVLRRVDDDAGARAIVLTGAGGKAFCAGADIGHMRRASALEAREFALRGHAITGLIEDLGTPVVAAVNGFALGGGCEIALACDVRLAGERARFGQPEVTLGVVPGWGGTQRLARATSAAFAKDLILTGRLIGADEALRAGLVSQVHPDAELLDAAIEVATAIASRPGSAVAAAKRLCNLALGGDAPGPYAREIDSFALSFGTPDQQEGMDAFFEKRPPRFAGHEPGEAR
ncbi:MAG: enoyl-CoA hydratase/isomerase family protein [Thermoleophilia bacterium]